MIMGAVKHWPFLICNTAVKHYPWCVCLARLAGTIHHRPATVVRLQAKMCRLNGPMKHPVCVHRSMQWANPADSCLCFRDFDIGSILRPTPVKAETVRRAGESQDAASQSLPIHSLHTPDLAALQGSQGMATSLSALQNDLQSHDWQHLDGASQQSQAGQNGSGRQTGQPQEGSQQAAAALHSSNGSAAQQSGHVSYPFDQRPASSQQQSQQGSQSWEAGLLQVPSEPNSGSQQQARLPKRKLPFSVGVQPAAKRQSPGPDGTNTFGQGSQGQSAAAQATSDRPKNGALALSSPHKSPAGHSKAQLMSPSLLLVAQQESPSHVPAQQQSVHTQSSVPVSVGPHTQSNAAHWAPTASAMLH